MVKAVVITAILFGAAGFAAGWYAHDHKYPSPEKRMERAGEKMREALQELTK